MTNTEIVRLLRNVAAAYAIINDKKYYFQITAYQKAADTIEQMTVQITDLAKEEKLGNVNGIGTSIKAHLEELVDKGQVTHFTEILNQVPAAVFPLLDVPSIGPKKAIRLVRTFNLSNSKTVIKDVQELASTGKISQLEGFGEKSQADILRAITEFHKGAGKITRMLLPFANELAEELVKYLKKNTAVAQAQPLGSLRRKAATVGDIDIAVATHDPQNVISHFIAYPYKDRVIEQGPFTASIMTNGGHQVDLMTQPVEGFGSLLQHFTGSKHHNVHLRDYALRNGLSLSEYGIKKAKDIAGKRKLFNTEEGFYQALGMDWIPPEIREDTGEIERALAHTLPRLIELDDMKGDLHIHSSFPIEPSHDMGTSAMEEMIEKAKKLGYSYLGFSEHNPSQSKHTKQQMYSLLEKRKEKIEHLKSINKDIQIINLLEVDIMSNGSLAIDDKCFEFLDAAIVSIHSVFSMDKEKMTQRVLKGLSHPKARILAHPTGRLLNQRSGFELDFDTIFAFCKEKKKALEINAWPERTDLPDRVIRQAVSQNVLLAINTDSHGADHMNLMKYGVWNARRGWAEKDDVLNAMEYNKFVQWLKQE